MKLMSAMVIGGLALAGCGGGGGSPLDGTWTLSEKEGAVAITIALTFSGGSLTLNVSSPLCTGSLTISGLEWTSTPTTITLSGTEACSGTLTCDGTTVPCSSATTSPVAADSTSSYVLSNGDDTLTITDSSGTKLVLTRQ